MSLLKVKGIETILNRVTIKKFKEGFGHDLRGYYCDVYLDKKKMGYVNDDGRGGDVQIEFDDKTKQATFEAYLKENNVAQLLFDNGWDFMETVEKIDYWSQGLCIVEDVINLKVIEKARKKIIKLCEHSIVYGTVDNFTYVGWGKKIALTTIVNNYPSIGLVGLQKEYDKIKTKMTDGQKILNTNLVELGVKL